MPEFEEENPNASHSQSYTPSTDASTKPRTRRRSGGFKTELAPISNAKIGEVRAAEALKEEKLSGRPSPETSHSERPERPRSERKPRPPRAEGEPRAERQPKAERQPRAEREIQERRTDVDPQPSPETLAAIASVEAKIAKRRAEKDARRAERTKTRPAKGTGGPKDASSARRSDRGSDQLTGARRSRNQQSSAKKGQGGLLAAISGFFGKLLGSEPEPAQKRSSGGGSRSSSGDGRPRSGQNRGRSGSNTRGGKNRGQNRRRSGSGSRGNASRKSENLPS